MFDNLTAAGIIAQATTFAASINGVVLTVVGGSLALGLAGWVVAKFRRVR